MDFMTDTPRKILVAKMRESTARDAEYARMNFRHRQVDHPLPVESKTERWRWEAEERAAREAEHHERQEAERAAELTEARRHELAVARSWGRAAAQANSVVDEDLLQAISSALTSLVARVEALEEKVESLGGAAADTGRRVDAISAKTKTGDEKKGRQLSTVERKLQDQHDFARDLKTDLRLLKAKVNALEKKPQQQETHIIHHGP
jgi:hypothetical protein